MKIFLIIATVLLAHFSFAQTPEDGLRTAWFIQNGTARNNAIGGVMGSLGGDLSAANINPAGLAMYRTKEFVISNGFNINNNNFNYRDTTSSSNKSIYRYGPMGFVLGSSGNYNKNNSTAFSISVSQLASYNNRITYSGFNNYSSFSEQYLEELVKDNADTNAALGNYIFGSSLAFRTYLIDTFKNAAGKLGYKSLTPIYSKDNPNAAGINQYYDAVTKGGYHEIAIAFAQNDLNKWYYGGALTIPLVSYQRVLNYSEYDATKDTSNRFGYFNFSETFKSFGVGIGVKLGAIYRPNENLRLGLAFHTPQFISFKDNIRASMTTNTENFKGIITETSNALNDNNPGERKYIITTPYRAIASLSYFFNSIANAKKQVGFISADVEFVNYRGVRFSKINENGESSRDYYKSLNNAIKEIYKGNLNIKVGGEYKLTDAFAARLGAAYYGTPYVDDNIQADKLLLTTGFGFRAKSMYVDVALSHNVYKDVQFPYRLNDKSNTYATQNSNAQTVMITLGFKL